jgi:hypothetical protein
VLWKDWTLERVGLMENAARLSSADLTNADLRGADLQNSVFTGANLQGAKFKGAHLLCADFRGARGLDQNEVKQGEDWQIGLYDESCRKSLGLQIPIENMPIPFEPGKKWHCPFP